MGWGEVGLCGVGLCGIGLDGVGLAGVVFFPGVFPEIDAGERLLTLYPNILP